MTEADLLAALLLAGLMAYALTGGADFGGGVWDLLASGPRARAQRRLIEQALAPVWEANHVWLVLVITLLASGFPRAFAAVCVALHIPLALALLGITLRGSAFVFRHHGAREDALRWGRVFAVASVLTPVALGVTLGALSSGALRLERGAPAGGWVWPWLQPWPVLVGLLALSAFAFLAAVYLTVEAGDDVALALDFRARAQVAGATTMALALVAALAARRGAPRFFDALVSWEDLPLLAVGASVAAGALQALAQRRYRLARPLAAACVALLVLGWGLAQRPFLVAPDVTIRSAAAPPASLRLTLGVALVGGLVVGPALYALLRVFKSSRTTPEDAP